MPNIVLKTPLMMVSEVIKNRELYEKELRDRIIPRIDYMEISNRLNAELIGYPKENSWLKQKLHQAGLKTRVDLLEAIRASRRLQNFQGVLSASEKSAIPLAWLAYLQRLRIPHVMIAHHISSANKQHIFRIYPILHLFNHLICVSAFQAQFAIQKFQVPSDQVTFIYDKVDHLFFQPQPVEEENFVLAVGKEQRDYKTLIEATEGTGIKVAIVIGSRWSSSSSQPHVVPEHVTLLQNLTFLQLRDIYARAKVVVVPLKPVFYAAGVNALLEGFAMARPVIASNTAGIREYLDPGKTAITVTPGQPAELRDALLSLWHSPEQRRSLGKAAREVVETKMNMDIYTEQVCSIFTKVLTRAVDEL